MIYYKNPVTGEVFAYESAEDRDTFGDPSLVSMTESEVEVHLNPPRPPLTRGQVERLRLLAYADPLSGCDRYFAEAQRMQAMDEDGWEVARSAGVTRFEEIQLLYPWP